MKALPIEILRDIEHNDDLVVGRKFDGFSELFVVENGVARLFNRSGKEHTLSVPPLRQSGFPFLISRFSVKESVLFLASTR